MDFSGIQTIAAPQAEVWAYLSDVNKVAVCAPGFQSLEPVGPEHWKAQVAVSVGLVKAKFQCDLTRPEMREPDLMVVKARGKAPGSAVELEGNIQLSTKVEGQTQMDWRAHVVMSGTLASIGARLMSSTAEKLTAQFFECLQSKLQASSTGHS